MQQIPFTEKDLALGKACLLAGGVRLVTFSSGTYQVEVVEGEESFFPFFQLDDDGKVLDFFCTCQEPSPCVHLAAAYLSLFKEDKIPLHKRFHDSFWNQLCFVASTRFGSRIDVLEKSGKKWQVKSEEGKVLFSLKPKNRQGEEKLLEILEARPVETEETSLKFFNLSEQEIRLWKQGRPSDSLRYELSFWSDCAKWLFMLQEEGVPYELTFLPEGKLPKELRFANREVEGFFSLEAEDLEALIPSLRFVKTSFKVYEAEELSIQKVAYDEKKRAFLLTYTPDRKVQEGVFLGAWQFVPGSGFFSSKLDPLLETPCIEGDDVARFLSKYTPFLKKHLQEKIHEGLHQLSYQLFFDEKKTLHIDAFLSKPGDLAREGSAFFGRWAYLPKKGFFYLQAPVFRHLKTEIPAEKVPEFLDKKRAWLCHMEGFQTHLTSVEAQLSYGVDEKGGLRFFSHMDIEEEGLEVVDLDGWVFVKERGFFPKKKEGVTSAIWAGKQVEPEDIPLFLRLHKEELRFIPHFFTEVSPIQKVSFKVFLEKKSIRVEPIFSLGEPYEEKKEEVFFYGEYAYVRGEGFSKLSASTLPQFLFRYLEEKKLPIRGGEFLTHLKEMGPWIAELDPSLALPKNLELSIDGMERMEEKQTGEWLLQLSYRTEFGSLPVKKVWQALHDGDEFYFSPIGLLDLSQSRFQWLKGLTKKRFEKEKLSLGALEWIRIQTLEKLILPEEGGEKAQKTRDAFSAFAGFQGFLPLCKDRLKSQLRNYQETGLKWLWFLYCYGLSGLLCDEMGLGKTHQAMGLMAAAFETKKNGKPFLIVCPTSVIYHWEELLKRFLPDLRVYVFYGLGRKLSPHLETYDILLTSYGVMRSEKKKLSTLSFEIGIYDEIQNAKNAQSQTHKAIKELDVHVSIGLTGTPIENRITELKALFDLILPHYLPGEAQFKEHFVVPIERDRDPDKKALLSKLVGPFILRRKKTEVLLELPEKTEEIAYCDLSEEQKKIYQELIRFHREEFKKPSEGEAYAPSEEKEAVSGIHIFALFSKLKQVCDHPTLISGDIASYEGHASGKWDLFVELLEEARESGQKVVVFTQFLAMMDIIKAYLSQKGVGFAEIRGSTKDRGGALKKFKEDPTCEVFIASLQAAGVGIDLTAASVVIHYDRWWNPARENQATDRVHRIGQSRGVQVFKLVTKKTIEERIHELILKKTDLLDEVVGFDDQDVIKRLTRKEIFELFASLEEDLK